MDIFYQAELSNKPLAAALGFFDGLHLGHKAVIDEVLIQKENGLIPTVITFAEHPQKHLKGELPPLLMQNEHKLYWLEKWGIERVYLLDFSSFAEMPAEEFIQKTLRETLSVRFVSCGFNFRFGAKGKGTGELLCTVGESLGMRVKVVPSIKLNGEDISSTKIRSLLSEGKPDLAAKQLGRYFSYSFEVVHGRHLGTAMGTPTLNQVLPDNFIMPRFGVYASRALIGDEWFVGVTNVGVKPTVGSDCVLSETWLPYFSGDLYGQHVFVELIEFIRPERKFYDLAELKEEILKNRDSAEKIIAKIIEKSKL